MSSGRVSRGYARLAVNLFLVVFTLLLVISGQPLSPTFRLANMAAAVVPAALLGFENWAWHVPLIQRFGFFPGRVQVQRGGTVAAQH